MAACTEHGLSIVEFRLDTSGPLSLFEVYLKDERIRLPPAHTAGRHAPRAPDVHGAEGA